MLKYFISILLGGLTFTQTKRTPFRQGILNVLPVLELTGTIAACGLCTDDEVKGHSGVSSFLMYPEVWRPTAETKNPQTC